MKPYIEALRLGVTIPAALLTFVAFYIVRVPEQALLPAFTVLTIASTGMVQNDWRDRFHDVQKNKTLAAHNPKKFLAYLVILWAFSTLWIIYWAITAPPAAILTVVVATAVLVYSEVRRIMLIPTISVALLSATTVLFPLILGYYQSNLITLTVIVFIFILGREIIKDLIDLPIDTGYKRTIPTTYGIRISKIVSGSCLLAAAGGTLLYLSAWLGVLGLLIAIALLLYGEYKKTLHLLNIGMVCLLIEILL